MTNFNIIIAIVMVVTFCVIAAFKYTTNFINKLETTNNYID